MHLYKPTANVSGIHEVKPGSVLVARKIGCNDILNRSVILILEHDDTGSTGIILNKSTLLSESLSVVTNKKLSYGGAYDTHRIGFIHSIDDVSKKIRITDSLYFSENSTELERFSTDPSNENKLKAFVGFTVWAPGQLEEELREKKWGVNDLRMDELYEVDPNELWGYKLLSCGNIYGLLFDLPDPVLN